MYTSLQPNFYLQSHGHEVQVLARDKDVTLGLLNNYEIPYIMGSNQRTGLLGLGFELITRTFNLIRVSRRFRPDVLLSVGSPAAAWAATVIRKPHLAFDDTEAARLGKLLYLPARIAYIHLMFLRLTWDVNKYAMQASMN